MATTITIGEHAAHWWLPEYEDCRVVGRYIVNADGTILIEFYESLQEKIAKKKPDGTTRWSLSGPEVYPLLYGSVDGMLVTAISLKLHSMRYMIPGEVQVEQRQPKYTVESRHYLLEQSDLLFKKVRIRPRCLPELTGWHKGPDESKSRADDGSHVHIIEVATEPIETASMGDARVELHQHALLDVANHDDSVNLHKTGTVVIELAQPVDIGELNSRFICPIMYMLTLLSGQPEGVRVFEFCAETMPYPQDHFTDGVAVPELWMTVRSPVLMRAERMERKREPLSLLDLVNWANAVPRWLEWAESATAEMQLMYLLMLESYPWLEARFITCAQMVEGIHRKTFSVTESAIQDNDLMVANVLSTLKDSGRFNSRSRRKIKSGLKYLYEPSLENRILQLDKATGGIISGLDGVDIKIVAKRCAELRNAFAHSTDRRPVNDLRTVHVAYAALYLLGLTALLARIDGSIADAVAKVQNWSGTRRLVNIVKEHWRVLDDNVLTDLQEQHVDR